MSYTADPSPPLKEDFDIGPLSWVKPEIQSALARADEGIRQFGAQPADHQLIRSVLPLLHQVTGALRMVGLEPVTLVSIAIEKLVEALAGDTIKPTRDVIATVLGASKALNRYLEGLMRGEPNRPLVLFPIYRSVLATTGSDSASALDLFLPDLSLTPEFTDSPATRAGPERAALLAPKRAEFQKGLLQVLRGADHQPSLANMHRILSMIEALQPADKRALWWIAAAFMEGLALAANPPGAFQKQLCGRIDLEIKHQATGADTVSEPLLRKLLFAIAHMQPTTARLREIHTTYRLKSLFPPEGQESPESTRVRGLLHDLKILLETLQETWLNSATGSEASLRQFAAETTQLNNHARNMSNKSLRAIFAKLVEVGNHLVVDPHVPSEALALDVATLLLIARDALDNYAQLGANFDNLTRAAIVRVTAALRSRPLPGSGAVQIVDVQRTAQEKKLFLQLGQEMLRNLNLIEGALDAFFRDSAKRTGLSVAPGYIKQLQGALAMLESHDAINLLKTGSDLVQKFITVTEPISAEDAERTAEVFSNLGLFVVAMQQGHENPGEMLAPALDRFGITPSQPVAPPVAAVNSL